MPKYAATDQASLLRISVRGPTVPRLALSRSGSLRDSASHGMAATAASAAHTPRAMCQLPSAARSIGTVAAAASIVPTASAVV